LSDISQCFLFYAEKLWTRATGGLKGVPLSRMGGGIDDKELFAESVRRHQQANKCGPFAAGADGGGGGGGGGERAGARGEMGGGYPPSVLLKDPDACQEFFQRNHLWAARDDEIWFVKDAHGSLGRHIRLLRRRDVMEMARNGSYSCPMPGHVAALEVPHMWTPGNRKFDHRYYVLIPSLDPLLVLLRRGYLRFSTFAYTRSKDAGDDDERDRMRHVTNLAIQVGIGRCLLVASRRPHAIATFQFLIPTPHPAPAPLPHRSTMWQRRKRMARMGG